MKNKKGIALPIVMIFMVISQMLYLSLLQYNQIQSQRYQGFIRYYKMQIQLMMTEQMISVQNEAQQLEEALIPIFNQQQTKLLKSYRIVETTKLTPQIWLLKVENNLSEERVILLVHRLFIDENRLNMVSLPQEWQLDGYLASDKRYHRWSETTLDTELIPMMSELKAMGYHEEESLSHNYQGKVAFQRPNINHLTFNEGQIEVKKGLVSTEIIAYHTNEKTNNRYRKSLPDVELSYLIETMIYVFKME